MSLISELGPITGANTRSEDLFVIVNLIQGEDGTKNITRKELVQALQFEIFNRITITGGVISNVRLSDSTASNLEITTSSYENGTINTSTISDSTILDSTANNMTVTDSSITDSDFSDGTGNNNVFTNTTLEDSIILDGTANNIAITNSDFSDGTGNNNIFTNSQVDESSFANVSIEGGTANNLTLTNITIDEIVLEDAFMSNSEIITTNFSNGFIWDTEISNSDIFDTNANNVVITNSEFNDGTANNVNLLNSDFSDGTGNNNVFTNTTVRGRIEDSIIANTEFTGTMDGVVAENLTITSSSAEGLTQTKSTFDGGEITDTTVSNSSIEESSLVDFDMDLTRVFEPKLDEDSYFAIKNVKTGVTEKMTYRQLYQEFSKTTEKALKVHVASDGNDDYDGTMLKPVKTLKRASELAIEKAGGNVNRNDINNAIHISVGPGTYYVDEPIPLPDDCALTSTAGQYATVIQKKPGWEKTNGILVGSGCYVQGFAYMNFEVDNFDHPEGGFAIAYRPGALMRRSPYLRDSSQLSNFNRLDVEPSLNPFNSKGTIADLGQEFYLVAGHSAQSLFEKDDEVTFSSGATGYISYINDIDSNRQIYIRNLKGNVEVGDILYAQRGGTGTIESVGIDDFPNRLVGRGGGCLLADRAVLDTDSLYTYVLCFGFTPRTQNGTGYVAKNGAGVNGIGSLSIFTRQAFFALNGGQMTLNNSGSQFGDISMRASGSTTIIKPAEANESLLIANTTFSEAIVENSAAIIDDMIDYLTANTSTGYGGAAGLGYQGYNADKCFRDTGIIVDNTAYDIATKGNYWGRLNGITYRSPISYVVVNEQLTETVGSIEHLKADMEAIFENANTEVTTRIGTSLDETLNILQNGEENANPIVFTDTGKETATAAREVVQDNRTFIIEQFIDWLDNNEEFYAYDSAKCKRDVQEYILPAVKYDAMLDTNYNSVTAGNAYYFNATKNVINGQREETIAAYQRLRQTTDKLIEQDSPKFAVDAYAKFNEILSILENDGTKFTPTAATYDPATGDFVVTIGAHTLEVGRYIILQPESFTFSCDTDGNKVELKHPRPTEKAHKAALPITATTATTITLKVGSTGYKGVHTLVDVADNAVSVLGSAITFSDNASIPADKKNARKQLQSNKKYTQDYMMNWADDEWFFYDSIKCQRDTTDYIVPAVLRDAQTGTNFNAIQSGIAYRGGTAKVTAGAQNPETVGAFTYLKTEAADVLTDAIFTDKVESAFDEFIGIMQTDGIEYTPETATYDPSTGDMTLTIEGHNLKKGDQITFAEEAVTFSCANTATNIVTEISHPRSTDPLFDKPVQIISVASDVVTVNVGNAGGYTGAHTFVRAKNKGIKQHVTVNQEFTPLAATYDPLTGIMVTTIGTHNIKVGDRIIFDKESITFECDSPAIQISHPRVTDPIFNTLVEVTAVTATTITTDVGVAGGGYSGVHTFVSALSGAVKTVNFPNGMYTPTNATYNPTTGIMTATIGSHNLIAGETIKFKQESITFSCPTSDTDPTPINISHPRTTDQAFDTDIVIQSVTDTTITMQVGDAGGYTGVHTFVEASTFAIRSTESYTGKLTPKGIDYNPLSGDMIVNVGQHNLKVGKWISIADESITLSCANTAANTTVELSHPRPTEPAYRSPVRITGVTGTTFTVNVGNASGYTSEHTFVSADADCIDTNAIYWTDPAKIDSFHTPTSSTYNSSTGVMELTMGPDHGFTTDDHIEFKPQSIVFSCANTGTGNIEEISHPRIGEKNYEFPLAITAVTANTITVNPGASPDGYAGVHTFVSAEKGSVVKTPAEVTREGKIASEQLIANRTFLQDETDAWIRDNYFVYKKDLCFRDVGLILNAVARDVQTGSNVNSVFAGLAYRSGNPSAQAVIDDELTETVGSINFLKDKIQADISDATAITRAGTAFDEIVDIMNNGKANADALTFGANFASQSALDAKTLIQANRDFIIAETTAWIADNHPDLTYDVADCERDMGYFTDSVSWDIQHGSNAATVNNSRLYYDNAVGVLAAEEITPTAEVFEYIAELAGQIVRNEVILNPAQSANTQTFTTDVDTPTDASYDPETGVFSVTIGAHSYEKGDYVIIDADGVTFSCRDESDVQTTISHPRVTDPYYNTPMEILETTATTITMNVGNAGTYRGVHEFSSATADCVKKSSAPTVAQGVVDLYETVAKMVRGDDFSELPALVEPTSSISTAITADAATITGSIPKYQQEVIDFIRDEYNGLGFDTDLCYRDIGMIVDAIAEDMDYGGDAATINAANYYFKNAINILPMDQREPTRLAFEHLADTIEDVVQETTVTRTTGNTTTQKTLTVGGTTAATALRAKNLTNTISAVVDDRLVIPDYEGSLDKSVGQQTPRSLPQVTAATKPKIAPSRTYARKALQRNKDFIQDEVVAFINDKYFVYDENKCERDVSYILDAVKLDVQTGSDYPSKYAGRAYRAGTVGGDKVIEEQLAETIEAIKYLKKDIEGRLSGVALTRATAAFDNITSIMKNGTTGLTYTSFGTAKIGDSQENAADGLKLNRTFLQKEGRAYFEQTYPTLWAALSAAQRDKCERDIGFLVDAACFDIQHGSNVAMRDVARLYFENSLSVLPADQRAETAGVFTHVASVAELVLLKTVVTPTTGNLEGQIVGFAPVAAPVAATGETLINIVSTIITENSLFAMPTAVQPETTAVGADGYLYEDETAVIAARVSPLATAINDFLQETFDYLEYNSKKCRRDVGYMVDAISHDIQYGGNAAMWNAAQIYFVNAVNLLPKEQREPTKESFTHMANVIHDVIRNTTITKTTGNAFTQDKTTMVARRVIATEAKDLALMVANIVDDNNPTNLPSRVEPTQSWMPTTSVEQKNLIDNDLTDLVTDMINFISTEYKGISYPKEKCRRDVGIIIDALSHDVQYETNYATRLSANMYFDNAVSVLPFDQRTQTADFYAVMADLLMKVVTETASGQDVTGTPATAVEAEYVADLVRVIEESIRRNSLDAVPDLVEPNTSWVDADVVTAADAIDNNLDDLADDVTKYIADNFTIIDYSKAKCRRDSGYIIDAMSWDLNYGGNLASRWNADFYFWNNVLRIPENTREATAQSYRELGRIVADVVTGSRAGQTTRPSLGTDVEADQAKELGMIFYNALFYNSPKSLGPMKEPNFAWETDKQFNFAKDILGNNKIKLQKEVQRFITSTYKFVDLPKTYRDANNLLKVISQDVQYVDPSVAVAGSYSGSGNGSANATRAFAAALFNIDSQHVFPVFNPPSSFTDFRKLRFKGTKANGTELNAVENPKRWDAYIIPTNNATNRYVGEIRHWNGTAWVVVGQNNADLLYSFYSTWERMRDYINTNIAPDSEHRDMITELFNSVLIESVLRPNFLAFGSLVESIAHQFNGASAGVNRNALPLNFRNVGAAIGATASVLSEDGGRIRWSGSDELNNQYFARGLRINGRTGRIEGRPFTSSVRKLARRASNSRASL